MADHYTLASGVPYLLAIPDGRKPQVDCAQSSRYDVWMRIICIHGAPGVGKLTVARALQAQTNAVLVDDHLAIDSAWAVFEFGTKEFSILRSQLFAAILDAAASTRRMILTTHADDVFWSPDFDAIIQGTLCHGYEAYHALLTCEDLEHAKRIGSSDRSKYRKITDFGRLKRLAAAGEFRPISPDDAALVLDITSTSPRSAAKMILNSIEAKSTDAPAFKD